LTAHRKIAPMTQTSITSNFDQPLDMHLRITPQITFNFVILDDEFTERGNFSIG
jgi:hypothetical protein